MRYSLRQTPSQLHLAYQYGRGSESLMGRHFVLDSQGPELTLSIDLTPNLHARSKSSVTYLDAMKLAHNHDHLAFLQCGDNLVRARLIRFWDRVVQPVLRMELDLTPHGRFLYSVSPHSLFVGGIQLDVREVLGVLESQGLQAKGSGAEPVPESELGLRSHV